MYTARAKQGHTIDVYDLEFKGQRLRSCNSNIFYIPDLENVKIHPVIKSVSCLQQEIRKVKEHLTLIFKVMQ